MRQVFFVPVVSRSLASGWGKGGLRKMGNAKVEESKKVVTNYDIMFFFLLVGVYKTHHVNY